MHCEGETNCLEYRNFFALFFGRRGLCRVLQSFLQGTVYGELLMLAVEMSVPFDSSSVLEFHGQSYVELKLSNNVAKTFAYEIWFLPTKPDGELLIYFDKQRHRKQLVLLLRFFHRLMAKIYRTVTV